MVSNLVLILVLTLNAYITHINADDQLWQLNPHIERDKGGNTKADVNIKRHGENHDFEAGWSKVIEGPHRAKPTWHVGGTFRWRRSLQPGAPQANLNKNQQWQLDPHIERNSRGNTRAGINIKRHGESHDLEAGWSKIIRGPNKAKPSWHVGGTFRWRRSLLPCSRHALRFTGKPCQRDIKQENNSSTKNDVNVTQSNTHDSDGISRSKRFLQPNVFYTNTEDRNNESDKQLLQFVPHDENDELDSTLYFKPRDLETSWSKVIGESSRWRRLTSVDENYEGSHELEIRL